MMSKIKVVQQVLDPSGSGGVSAEYRALQGSELLGDYEFIPMILMKPHNGVNFRDIAFYYRFLKRNPGDIVHIRGAAPDGLNAVIAAKLAGTGKILVSIHGMYSDLIYISPFKRWISYHIIERWIFRMADGISCVCMAAHERKRFRKYRKKMLPYVYNRMPNYSGYDRQQIRRQMRRELGLDDSTQVGVYVGRVTREKGLDYLAQAIEKMPDNSRMLVVGDGAYLEEMKAVCGNRAIFLANQKEVYRYLFASDFFVQPSLHENHSIALLEAVAAGLPVIATNVGGNGEIVKDGLNGVLIPPADTEKLRDAIWAFCGDAQLMLRLKAQTEVVDYSDYSNASVDRRLRQVYQMLLSDVPARKIKNRFQDEPEENT